MLRRLCLSIACLLTFPGAGLALPTVPKFPVRVGQRQSATALYGRGWQKLVAEEYAPARELFDQAIALDGTLARAYRARGVARCHLGDRKGAIEDYLQAAQLFEAQGMSAESIRDLAVANAMRGNYAPALDGIDQAIALAPEKALYYINRAQIRMQLSDRKGAFEDLTTAENLSSASAYVLRGSGALRTCLGDTEGAIAAFNRTLALDPTLAIAYHRRAMLKLQIGERDAALTDLQTAADLYEKQDNSRVQFERNLLQWLQHQELTIGHTSPPSPAPLRREGLGVRFLKDCRSRPGQGVRLAEC